MPRTAESPLVRLLKLSNDMRPDQILDAIEILKHRYQDQRAAYEEMGHPPVQKKRGRPRRATETPTEPAVE